jgi:hypothetical protein
VKADILLYISQAARGGMLPNQSRSRRDIKRDVGTTSWGRIGLMQAFQDTIHRP